MVLYVVGLGLGDEQDITLRGLSAVKKAKKVFLENYTSVLGIELSRLVSGLLSGRVPVDRRCDWWCASVWVTKCARVHLLSGLAVDRASFTSAR